MQSWILRNGSGKNPYSVFQQWTKHETMDVFPDEFQFKSYHSTWKLKKTKRTNQTYITLHLGGGPPRLISVNSRFKQRNIFTPGRPLPPRWWETPPLEPVARKLPPKNAGWNGETWTNTRHFKGFSSSWLKIHPVFFVNKNKKNKICVSFCREQHLWKVHISPTLEKPEFV